MANKQDRSSATWSRADVATLVHTLAEEKARGNWVDNRPKAVAWTSCELALMNSERKSGGGVKTLQSIQNRWQRVRPSKLLDLYAYLMCLIQLKTEYDIVKDLRATSGFKWNEQEQSIRAPREVWDAYIKVSNPLTPKNKLT